MVLSSTHLKSCLEQKAYEEAASYASQQLAEARVANDKATVIASSQKCINVLAFHLYHVKPSSENKTCDKNVAIPVDIFIQALECLLEAGDMVDVTLASKVLDSIYYVSILVGLWNFHTTFSRFRRIKSIIVCLQSHLYF